MARRWSGAPGGRRSGRAAARLVLWTCTFAGGAVTGCGLLVLAQVRLIRFLRNEVNAIGVIGRKLGELTFPWRGPGEKVALAAANVPESYLEHGHVTGLVLCGVGLVGLAWILPGMLGVRRRARRGGA